MTQQFDASKVRVVLFDLFGTVVDMSGVPRMELMDYGNHLHRHKDEWAPFRPPESWRNLQAFPDARDGLERMIVGCLGIGVLSNCPARMAGVIAERNRLPFDLFNGIIQLAAARVFKPDPRAYQVACDVLDCEPSECLMVTANERFGDLEQSRALGMQACLIRGESDIPDIVALAERLGC